MRAPFKRKINIYSKSNFYFHTFLARQRSGVMKKGKVFKTSVDAWTKQRECGDREKAMLRGLSDPECVAVLLGDCRVAMPGLHSSSGPKRAQRGQKGKSTRGM